jgi:DNA-binding MarR family transcriptional regulator
VTEAPRLDRAGNLVGALALRIADEVGDAVAAASPVSGTGATVLSALHHFLERPTIDHLRRVLGLTSSGTVRAVDRLVDAGLVARETGDDARETVVRLTPAGGRAARRVSEARTAVLDGALGTLTATERSTLEQLAGKVLAGMIRAPGATRWTCRLCDTAACGRDAGECPVANAARARYG